MQRDSGSSKISQVHKIFKIVFYILCVDMTGGLQNVLIASVENIEKL